MSKSDHANNFIIDSGASQHITKDMGHFSSVDELGPTSVHLSDNTTITTKQQVSVLLKLRTRHIGITKTTLVLITKVLYIPESVANILSCSELDKSGTSIRFGNGNCLLTHRHEKNVFIGSALLLECNGLYMLDAQVH